MPIALATDTFSIAVMEIVDNGLMLAIPGAMEAGVGDVLFWGALSVALVIAGVVAFPVNRWLITRGKGHAVLHESGHHPNFPTRLVAIVAGAAFIFGSTVLVAEAFDSDSAGHGEMAGELRSYDWCARPFAWPLGGAFDALRVSRPQTCSISAGRQLRSRMLSAISGSYRRVNAARPAAGT